MTNDAQQPENTGPTSPARQVGIGWFNLTFNLQDNTKLPLMFGVGCLAVLALSFSLSDTTRLSFTIPLLAAVGGITGFLYAQHARDIQLFRELFREFNARYGDLNDRLNKIRKRPRDQPLKDTDHDVLFAYFNLCAEEYMYATAGHIDSRVWCAWRHGMCYFDQDLEIHDLWKGELQQGSYYGFTLDCIHEVEVAIGCAGARANGNGRGYSGEREARAGRSIPNPKTEDRGQGSVISKQ